MLLGLLLLKALLQAVALPFFRHANAIGAQRGQALVRRFGEGVFLVPLGGVRPQLGLCKGAHGVADGFLVGGQQHGVFLGNGLPMGGALAGLLAAFTVGGIAGAYGFKQVGYGFTVPLALLLAVLALVPTVDDLMRPRKAGG